MQQKWLEVETAFIFCAAAWNEQTLTAVWQVLKWQVVRIQNIKTRFELNSFIHWGIDLDKKPTFMSFFVFNFDINHYRVT